MATLIDRQTQQRCILQSHHSFGRLKSSVNTIVSNAYVSKIHAFIEWNQQHWLLRDVSTNGTWVNGHKLGRDQVIELNIGDVITLASKSGYAFEVDDTSPPCDCLIPIEHNGEAIQLENFHLLPSEESHKMILSFNNQTYSWWKELFDENLNESTASVELSDKEYLSIDGLTWQLQINRTAENTQLLRPTITSMDELTLLFQTSQDEETTHILIQSSDGAVDLLVRSHHYLTLALARRRAEDIAAGVNESEQGWLYAELLAKDLGLDPSHLNIQIYRIRKQFVDALNNACESNNIIERNGGKLRLGSKFFCIIKGDQIESDTSQYAKLNLKQYSDMMESVTY